MQTRPSRYQSPLYPSTQTQSPQQLATNNSQIKQTRELLVIPVNNQEILLIPMQPNNLRLGSSVQVKVFYLMEQKINRVGHMDSRSSTVRIRPIISRNLFPLWAKDLRRNNWILTIWVSRCTWFVAPCVTNLVVKCLVQLELSGFAL